MPGNSKSGVSNKPKRPAMKSEDEASTSKRETGRPVVVQVLPTAPRPIAAGDNATAKIGPEAAAAIERAKTRASGGGAFEMVFAAASLRGAAGLIPRKELGALVRALAAKPEVPAKHIGALGSTLKEILRKVDSDALSSDTRFKDRAWHDNPLLNRLGRGYVAACDTALDILNDVDLDWRTRERLRMPADNLIAALSPTNTAILNPLGWKETIDTGGANLVRGAKSLMSDLQSPTRLPGSVDREGFTIGENIAATPGGVVQRERLFELIQYAATTETVNSVPILFVPSPVNKYYLLDLEPERSVVAELVAQGRQVFVISWVQPDVSMADAGFDSYIESVIAAMDTVATIAREGTVHLAGLCGGGQLAALVAGYLAATGVQDRLATLTIGICILNFEREKALAFIDHESGERAIRRATARGYFAAVDSARTFALMRPFEGIWSHVANNYVMGLKPPRMALLYWAADQTNMSVQFGADFIRNSLNNTMAKPGGVEILGAPIDLTKIKVDTYVLGGSTDHISPWGSSFETVAMLGSNPRFVLAEGGHAMVIAKPPSHARSTHWVGPAVGIDAATWFENAEQRPGTWWTDWSTWIDRHKSSQIDAPKKLGSRRHPVLGAAPGDYVRVVLT
ncbi:MAG: hypothetical protein JWR52_1150 [Marmoricola sp.]|nr:hypothetical protein [Marmoricola sp.]